MSVYRLFVEKRAGHDVYAKKTESKIKNILGLECSIRFFIRYDIEGITEAELKKAATTVFSEPPVDMLYFESLPLLEGYDLIPIKFLAGQYDQRADSAAQCVQMLTLSNRPSVSCASIYAVKGVKKSDIERITKLLVNPVECELASLEKPSRLEVEIEMPEAVSRIDGFVDFDAKAIAKYHAQHGFAMSEADLKFVQSYFRSENRNPTETELKVIDTYWSDHCRHTTFFTRLEDIKTDGSNPHVAAALAKYQELFARHNGKKQHKYPCLMDIATIGVKELKSIGGLKDLDQSEEINACSINVTTEFEGGQKEDWLVMFKNETHNHPTEIEPFGGAATCLGGAIRDPLSGRAYVYQAMRVSGAANINEPSSATLKGKLPQRVISTSAASGFSSYGNQIGLATGLVQEFYHKGFRAKRLEAGFVVAAAKKENVVREKPAVGDLILLIGGATGRDGCGGATGSSKAHDAGSMEKCGAEVQKGNPLTERKLQRLFRNGEFSRLIKRCNDFGAGGVSVAIGELADSLEIELSKVPKKYQGLSATELAISESQERMAVVIDPASLDKILKACAEENVEATCVARVTDSGRMIMKNGEDEAVNLSREFLDTNGVTQTATAFIKDGGTDYFGTLQADEQRLFDGGEYALLAKNMLKKPSVCSQKGLLEMFDSTIGSGTVLMPLGGEHQLTPAIAMAAKLPASDVKTATVASLGYNPHLMSQSCFVGGANSVLESVIRVVAAGAKYDSIYLSLQEFFEKLRGDEVRWGKVTAALLGALTAQLELGIGAIGGKDSMSGSFENIDVPPTLISFALGTALAQNIITNVIQRAGQKLYRYSVSRDEFGMPDLAKTAQFLKTLSRQIEQGKIEFAQVSLEGGAVAAIIKSCMGSKFGFSFAHANKDLFTPQIGDIILSVKDGNEDIVESLEYLGVSTSEGFTIKDKTLGVDEAIDAFTGTFESAFPTTAASEGQITKIDYYDKRITFCKNKVARPRVLIPVFPGTNCEFDTARKFEQAGAETDIFVVKNLTKSDIAESVAQLNKRIRLSNIIAFPGGFSGGDEPDGSGKFIATTFRSPALTDAVSELLYHRDGLILGICNGFQALIKLGLLPHGKISEASPTSATLTFNNIPRHVSQMAYIKVVSTMSPWLAGAKIGEVASVAVSHGEGRFVATRADLDLLIKNGQIATRYTDIYGNETMQFPLNPNGSMEAVEGITSPDGRILGKMGHSERSGKNLYKNVIEATDMNIFISGVKYFK